MTPSPSDIGWDRIETFLRVAEAGSLTAAARQLRISQPTLSRQIAELEERLGVGLFVRHGRGLALTDRGAELLSTARDLDQHAQVFLRRAAGLRAEPSGTVRISANEPIGIYVLQPCLARLRAEHPKIALELVVENSAANLSRREADIAVRMFRPRQPDLVAKRLGTLELGLYGHVEYLARHGEPKGLQDATQPGQTVIGFDRDPAWLVLLEQLRLRPEHFAFRSDSLAVHMQAVLAGVGLGVLHVLLAARHPELRRVLEQVDFGSLELWLVMHEDVRESAAVRVVFEALAPALEAYASS